MQDKSILTSLYRVACIPTTNTNIQVNQQISPETGSGAMMDNRPLGYKDPHTLIGLPIDLNKIIMDYLPYSDIYNYTEAYPLHRNRYHQQRMNHAIIEMAFELGKYDDDGSISTAMYQSDGISINILLTGNPTSFVNLDVSGYMTENETKILVELPITGLPLPRKDYWKKVCEKTEKQMGSKYFKEFMFTVELDVRKFLPEYLDADEARAACIFRTACKLLAANKHYRINISISTFMPYKIMLADSTSKSSQQFLSTFFPAVSDSVTISKEGLFSLLAISRDLQAENLHFLPKTKCLEINVGAAINWTPLKYCHDNNIVIPSALMIESCLRKVARSIWIGPDCEFENIMSQVRFPIVEHSNDLPSTEIWRFGKCG
jgi:hypothetical protein